MLSSRSINRIAIALVLALTPTALALGQESLLPDSDASFARMMMLIASGDEGPTDSGSGDEADEAEANGRDGAAGENDSAGVENETPEFTPIEIFDPQVTQATTLTIADVVASLYRHYPKVIEARQEPAVARGELVAAYGAYDTKLQGYSLNEAMGFYENYRHGIGVVRQSWWGTYLSAGYRIGRGSFQPWYKERETNKGGEFKLGLGQPLLRGFAIDPQRVAVFQASIDTFAAEPKILQALLDASRDAANSYWEWVTAGAILQAQQELLTLAETRGEQFKILVDAGKFAEIDLILNEQLIAERRGKVLESQRKFQASAFKLALYLRNDVGNPLIPPAQWVPRQFPAVTAPPQENFNDQLSAALARRPEPQLYQYQIRQVELDRRLACNDRLPRLDLIGEISQDMGEAATSSRDKGDFQLVIGVEGEVPLQRRKALGKIQSTTAKIRQLTEKLRLQRDQIATEIQIARNALELSSRVVDQAEVSLEAAIESLDRYSFAFERGKVDLIYLNLLETKANETEIKLIEAQRDWFDALADYQVALGLDPLDQAMNVAALPPSDLPKAGRTLLHEQQPDDLIDPEEFESDWEKHTAPIE
ncbi:TolC family protein [Crateriforma spongiae]|uniref:TolC family protein n=1 Tax=Crateriforma spongiae TaxID=2724528 RepID=UPI001F3D99E4|nr:TolC family protein [Crateriforma spongiae]